MAGAGESDEQSVRSRERSHGGTFQDLSSTTEQTDKEADQEAEREETACSDGKEHSEIPDLSVIKSVMKPEGTEHGTTVVPDEESKRSTSIVDEESLSLPQLLGGGNSHSSTSGQAGEPLTGATTVAGASDEQIVASREASDDGTATTGGDRGTTQQLRGGSQVNTSGQAGEPLTATTGDDRGATNSVQERPSTNGTKPPNQEDVGVSHKSVSDVVMTSVKLTEKEIATLLELIHTFSFKWEMIGTVLGFVPSELEQIKNMPSLFWTAPASFLKELLNQWVQWPTLSHPTKPTLRALCTSLRSSLVGLGSLADKVEMKMKQSLTCIKPAAASPKDHSESLDVSTRLNEFEDRFYSLHNKTCSELVAGYVDTSKILQCLTLLPLKLKKEYNKPIKELLPELKQQASINELFYCLNPLLSFMDYTLLEHIIYKFCSDELKREVVVYGQDIQVFNKQTTIQELLAANLPGEPDIPQKFEVLKAKLSEDASKYTLAEIDSFRRKVCAEIRLSEIVLHLVAIEDSNSFILSFLVPSVLVPDIIKSARKLDDSFFQRESISFLYMPNRWVHSPKLLRFGAELKERYHQSLASVSPSELIPSPTKKIFRLAMIQREKVQQGRIEDTFVRMTISGKVDDILHAKAPIELKNILRSTFHGSEIVLIEGAPGSGKSTLTVHICKKWGKGELFEQFSVVILVQLRDPAVQRAKSIADLLPCQDVAAAQELANEIVATNGRGILLVLDGWDELPSHLQRDSIFRNLLPPTSRAYQQKMLSESSVIVTSRPISSGDLHPVVSSRIEVLGFTPEEQRQYFTECLKGDSQALATLLEKIKENPVVQSICYLPLNAAFVVHTFKYKGQSLPSTVYEIYLSVILSIVSHHFCREGKGHELPGMLASIDDLSRSRVAGKDFQHLCEMAHRGVMQNKVTFSSSEFPEGSSTLSLLQGTQSFLEGGKSVFYNFLHLIIQEIMAAYYIATQLSESEQVSQFQQLFKQPRFAAVFQFYSAITKLKAPGMSDVLARMVKEKSDILLVSLLHCLYEAQDSSLCAYVAEQLEYKVYLSDTSLSPLDCLSLSFFLFSVASSVCKEVDVYLTKCRIGDLGVYCLTKYLNSVIDHGGKVALDLGRNNIHEEGASYIAEMLYSGNIVKHLYLWDNPIGDTGASFISNAVRETTTLKTLNMCNCGITSKGAEQLSIALAQNSSLEKLDIGWNRRVGDEGIRHIAEALKQNKQLKELWIGGCGMTDKGADYLASALSVNNTLKLLHMGELSTKLTKDGVSKLTQSLSHNTGLRKVVFPKDLYSHSKITLNQTRQKIGLPSIEIEGSDGLSDACPSKY